MNWKIVATLIVGALLVTACGAQQSAAPASGGTPTATPTQDPGTQPAATTPSKDPATDARKDIVVHQ